MPSSTKYLHPENENKPFVDWRVPELRQTAFTKWLNWRYLYRDLDHYNWNRHYMAGPQPDGKPMTREQKLWFCFFFGMTYQSSMAWVFYWHFPNPAEIDYDEMDKWNRATMGQQKFATDTRYNKGHLVSIVKSFLEWVQRNGGTLERAFDSFIVDGDEAKSFFNVFNELMTLHKFGRMTAWIFAQNLYECAELPIRPPTMFCSDPSAVSVWNGMMFLQNREDMTVGDQPKFAGYKPTAEDRKWVDKCEIDLEFHLELNLEDTSDYSFFSCESHLCQFKKLFVGFDYPGHSAGDATSRMQFLKEGFPNVNFDGFTAAVESLPEHIRWRQNSKQLFKLFQKTGQFINMHNHYPEMPNMLLELNIPDSWLYDVAKYEGAIEKRIDAYAAEMGLTKSAPVGQSSLEEFFS